MTYREAIDYLYNVAPAFEKVGASAYKEGLSNTLALDEHFNHPHQSYKTIHIAGTNGKGSTSHTLAAILQSAGYRVGLYTSPHLLTFCERIRVNGEMIPEQRVVDFVEQERSFFEPLYPSFFELTTALAFKYFEEQKVDIAVVEVGLGGRLDCTNIITPLLSIITNISFDHTQFLGNTLAQIATEKAGIIKEGIPPLRAVYHHHTYSEFREQGPHFTSATAICPPALLEQFQLRGAYQNLNARTILAGVEILREQGLTISDEAVSNGFAHVVDLTGLRGRWETLRTAPLTICDIGHNVAGWKQLSRSIADATHVVFGMVDDKDVATIIRMLPKRAKYYFTQANTRRAITSTKLLQIAESKGLNGSAFATVADAKHAVEHDAKPSDFIFIGGSNYLVADWLELE